MVGSCMVVSDVRSKDTIPVPTLITRPSVSKKGYRQHYLCRMNWLDILLAIILLTGAVRGFVNGFVYEIAHLGAYFLGLYGGFTLAGKVAPAVGKTLNADPVIVHYVSFFLVFVAVWIGEIGRAHV